MVLDGLGLFNRRPDYTSTSMEKLVSWDVVSARHEVAEARAAEREIEEARKKKEELYRQKKPAEVFVDETDDDSETG